MVRAKFFKDIEPRPWRAGPATGITEIDDEIGGGWPLGLLSFCAGRFGSCKTELMIQTAVAPEITSLFVTPDEPVGMLRDKMGRFAMVQGIAPGDLDERVAIAGGVPMTTNDVCVTIEAFAELSGAPDLVVVDYLSGMLDYDRIGNRLAGTKLKEVAHGLTETATVAITQMNRGLEDRKDKTLRASDVYGGGEDLVSGVIIGMKRNLDGFGSILAEASLLKSKGGGRHGFTTDHVFKFQR